MKSTNALHLWIAIGMISLPNFIAANLSEALHQPAAAVSAFANGPVAADDAITTDEDTPILIDVIDNDSDPGGSLDPATVTVISAPGNGQTAPNGSGAILYTPNENYFGLDSFTYTVQDLENNVSNVATVTVTVTDVNDRPTAVDDDTTIFVNTSVDIDVLENDFDVDGTIDPTTLAVTVPANGTALINVSGVLTYTPDPGYFGIDTFTYSVKDDDGRKSTNATVTIHVVSPPQAADDDVQTNEDTAVVIDILGNDIDDDGSIAPATVTIETSASHGATDVDGATGEVTYTPNENLHGDDSFQYSVKDDDGFVSNVATVAIEIVDVNDLPVVAADTVDTDEDTPITIDVVANDFDVDGTLDLSLVAITFPPEHGDVVLPGDGTVVYTPAPNFFGIDSLFYTVADDDSEASADTLVYITVNSENDLPITMRDSVAIDEDNAIDIDILANDDDVDGSLVPASVAIVAQPSHGNASVNTATGVIEYGPDPNYFGPDSLTYTVDDNDGGSSAATKVSITINSINDAPVAVNDSALTEAATPVEINLTANDIDVDGTINTLSLAVSLASDGNTLLKPNGSVIYTPNAGFEGEDTFSYTVRDDQAALSNSATVSITVTAPPEVDDDLVTTLEDQAIDIDVLENDSDNNGLDPGTLAIVSGPFHGNAVADAATGEISYTPAANFFGEDTLFYTIKDSLGIQSAQAQVLITVQAVNDAPVANNDAKQTAEDVPVAITILGNDTDVEQELDPASIDVTSAPGHGDVFVDTNTGVVTYTPGANYNGPDSFAYTVNDLGGLTSNEATVTITVTAINDAPLTVADNGETDEDSPVIIDVLANDSDVDGSLNTSSVSVVSVPAHGATQVNGLNGEITYTPAADYFGNDSFQYTVRDNQNGLSLPATVTITIAPINDMPIANDDMVTVGEGDTIQVAVLANDNDAENNLIASTVDTVLGPANGAIHEIKSSTGAITYIPDPGFVGQDTFTYTVRDGEGGVSNVATVTITVQEQSDVPVAVDDFVTTEEDTFVDIEVIANDIEFDLTLDLNTINIVSQPSNGVAANEAPGTVRYTPFNHYAGPDSFTYTVKNTEGETSNVATVSITVTPVNDAPVAVDDTTETDEETAVVINVVANDSDVDGAVAPLSVEIVSQPASGTAVVDGNTGLVTYTPNVDFNGEDSLTYFVRDDVSLKSNTATVRVTVNGVNDAPVAHDDFASTTINTPVQIAILQNDVDVDGTLVPASLQVTPSTFGTTILDASGILTYTPNSGFEGEDTFTYTVRDDDGTESNQATVTVNVGTVPTAVHDTTETDEDVAVTIAVLDNDSDSDGTLMPATVTVQTAPAHGSTNVESVSGGVTYTPEADFSGTDSFAYTVEDNDGNSSAPATVLITVHEINDPPVAVDDAVNTNEDAAVTFAVTANDTDVDGNLDPLTVQITQAPDSGDADIDLLSGDITYTPGADFFGEDTLFYTVADSAGAISNEARVIITVASDNDAPVALDDSATSDEDVAATIAVLDNDFDIDGTLDPATVTLLRQPTHGAASVNTGSGEIVYDPDDDYAGQDTLSYSVKDNQGATSGEAVVAITVLPVNDAPVALNDTVVTSIDTPVDIFLTANDDDLDGSINTNSLTVTLASNGTTTLRTDGHVIYTPSSGFTGQDSFTYTIRDNDNLISNTATVTIFVTIPPLAVDDADTTLEGQATQIEVAANDSDDDGSLDLSTVTIVTAPDHGTADIDAFTGVVTYTPNAQFSGPDSFTYTIADDLGVASNIATVNIVVDEFNDPPIAVDDTAVVAKNTDILIDVLDNDADVDGSLDRASLTITTQPSFGSASVDSEAILYAPGDNFGPDSLKYTVKDDGGAVSNIATVYITVNDTNIVPIAVNDTISTPEDTAVDIPVLDNDDDPDGSLNPASVAIALAPEHGGTDINATTGVITYTPDPDFAGQDSLRYTVRDDPADDESNTATVLISVTPVNDPPVAVDDEATIDEDTSVEIAVLDNDLDVDNAIDSTSVTVIEAPVNGAIDTVNAQTGSITYTPAANFAGEDLFVYEISDVGGGKDTASVQITVAGLNDAPIAIDDTVHTVVDTPVEIAILENDVEVDVDGAINPASISVSPASNGAMGIASNGVVTYTPAAGFSGPDTFTYTVRDNENALSNTATVTVNVGFLPVANQDTVQMLEDGSLSLDILANDDDEDGDLAPASLTIVTPPKHGAAQIDSSTRLLEYVPAADFFGFDTLRYTVQDDDQHTSLPGVVAIEVVGVNDAPVAVPDTVNTAEDIAVTVDVLANDFDVDSAIDSSSVSLIGGTINGVATVDGQTGAITFFPGQNFNGVGEVRYTVKDETGEESNEAALVVHVLSDNDPPVALADSSDTDEDVAATIAILDNDSDLDGIIDSSRVEITQQGRNGIANFDSDSGLLTYQPNQDFFGVDTVVYRVHDDLGQPSEAAIVKITVAAVNDAPLAVDDNFATPLDTPIEIDVLANDIEVDGIIDVSSLIIIATPLNGTAASPGGGLIAYTPPAGFVGTDRLTYKVQDDLGALSNLGTALIVVGGSGSSQTVTFQPTDDGQIKLTQLGANYGDKGTAKVDNGRFRAYFKFEVSGVSGPVSSATLRLRVASDPSDGSDSGGSIFRASNTFSNNSTLWTEALLNAGNAPALIGGVLSTIGTVVSDQLVEFDVSAAVSGNGAVSFCLTSESGDLVKYYTKEGVSPPQLVVKTGSGGSSNTAPVATTDNAATVVDTPVEIHVLVNDSDPDGALDATSVAIASQPNHGGVIVDATTGVITYTPAAGFEGDDTFSYTVADDEGATSNVALVTVDVVSGGSGALAFEPTEDGQAKLTDSGSNYGTKPTMKVEAGKFSSYLKFSVNGVTGPVVSAVLRLKVTDGANDGSESGGSVHQVSNNFSGSVLPWNELELTSGNAPEVSGPAISSVGAVFLEEVVDFDVSSVVSGDGIYSFALTNTSGDQVKYYTKEGQTPPRLIINGGVGGGNLPPVANDDNSTTPVDITVVIDVLGNDSDSDGAIDATTVLVTQPANGAAIADGITGQVTYTPNAGFSGTDSFTYTVKDNDGGLSNTATVNIIVGSGNVPPLAVDDSEVLVAGNSITIDVTLNDSDSDGTLVLNTLTVTEAPNNGTVEVSQFGLVTYTKNQGFVGADTFRYTVQDNDGAISNAATVTIEVQSAGGGSGATVSFTPTDDGQVKLTDASKNYGDKPTAKVEAGKFASYFKFNVTGITSAVQKATLRLQVTHDETDGSESGGSVFSVANDFVGTASPWFEALLTSGNAPAVSGSPLSTIGAVAPLQTVDFDVSQAVDGNGIFSFAITSTSDDQVKYFTREGAAPPELRITTSDGGGDENSPPVAQNDDAATAANGAVTIFVLDNDSDSDGELDSSTVTVVNQPSNGSTSIDTQTGAITYTPETDFAGSDSFTYQVQDDAGAVSNTATVSISVIAQNIPPVAVNDAVSIPAGQVAQIDVTVNDSDNDGALDVGTVTIVTQPQHGNVVVGAFGIVTYTPDAGFSGQDAFEYTVRDDAGASSNVAIVTIEVQFSGTPDTFTFAATDDGQVKPNSPAENAGDKGTMKVEKDQFISYMKFNVSGLTGPIESAKVRLRVTPDPTDGSDSGGSIFLASNNFEGTTTPWTEGGLVFANAPEITGNALSTLGAVSANTTVEFDVTGAVTGNGAVSFCVRSESPDQVKYFTKDGGIPPQLVIQAIVAGGGNNAPVAQNDNASTVENTAVIIDVLDNDSDSDGNLDVTTVTVQTAPANGTAVSENDGTILYTPNSGFSGNDAFTYTVNDDDGAASNAATVSVSVTPVGNTQVFTFQPTDDAYVKLTEFGANFGDKGTAKVSLDKFVAYFKFNLFNVSGPVVNVVLRLKVADAEGSDSDAGGEIYQVSNNFDDSQQLWVEGSLTAQNAPDVGGLPLSTVGRVELEALVDFDVTSAVTGNGIFSFAIRTESDDQVKYFTKESLFSPSLIVTTAQVTGVARGEDAEVRPAPDVAVTVAGRAVTIDVLNNDQTMAGQLKIGNVAVIAMPSHGFVRLNPVTGALTYTPNAGYEGTDSFQYVVYDSRGQASAPAEVVVAVTAANRALADDSTSTYAGMPVSVDVLQNDDIIESARGTLSIVSPSANGAVDLDGVTGIALYVPDSDFTGIDRFSYRLKGADGMSSDTAVVTIAVHDIEPQILTFLPTDDAFVQSSRPTDNFGSSYELRATNGKAEFYSYLKFNISGLRGPVRRATLRLYVFDDSDGGAVYAASNHYRDHNKPWRETDLVWDNAPEIQKAPLATFQSNGPGNYVDVDLTEGVFGQGVYSFVLSGHSADAAKYESREAANPPMLIIETGRPLAEDSASPDMVADMTETELLPSEFALRPNYPNPFNAATNITYTLPEDARVKLHIYNVRGQLVTTLVDKEQPAGIQRVKWLAKDNRGVDVGSGVYFMQLEVSGRKFSRRLVLQK